MIAKYESIADWLIVRASDHRDLRVLTDQLVVRLRDAGMPLHRLNLGVLALHPEMAGYAVLWEDGMADAVEFPIRHEDTLKPTYLDSPIRFVVEEQESVDFRLDDPSHVESFPVLREFQDKGFTHYVGFPVPYGDNGRAVLTMCTRDASGFALSEIEGVGRLFAVLSLLINVAETKRLAQTVLRTYLGRETGERVLAGKILRGEGERIQAALWFCDLRRYTAMTAEIGSFPMIDVMNQYFDCMADAVWAEGGEILKFMGDAMLVVFRIDADRSPVQAAQCAVRAAQGAQASLRELSESRASEGQLPLEAGISVHLGSVVYGNIGARSRLDFTVMGHSVNVVARIQSLTSTTGEPILFSSEVAEHWSNGCTPVGRHELKGVPEPVEVFKPLPSVEDADG